MNEWAYKIRVFLIALFSTFGGIIPMAGCTGSCGACVQCAGLGGVMAVLAVIWTARKKKKGEMDHGMVKDDY